MTYSSYITGRRKVAPVRQIEMPEPLQGRETWQQGYELVKRAFPDLRICVDDFIADGVFAEEWICSDMATLFRQLS